MLGSIIQVVEEARRNTSQTEMRVAQPKADFINSERNFLRKKVLSDLS
jgi:hypothetical protein